jgi:hypothetical protein
MKMLSNRRAFHQKVLPRLSNPLEWFIRSDSANGQQSCATFGPVWNRCTPSHEVSSRGTRIAGREGEGDSTATTAQRVRGTGTAMLWKRCEGDVTATLRSSVLCAAMGGHRYHRRAATRGAKVKTVLRVPIQGQRIAQRTKSSGSGR